MNTTVCHRHGCYRTAVPGLHYCNEHQALEAEWGKRKPVQRRGSSAWHQFYNSARWRREKAEFLARYPMCAICGAKATVVDHIVPHRGNEELFWNRDNWQSLCALHHGAKTMHENNYFRRKKDAGKDSDAQRG